MIANPFTGHNEGLSKVIARAKALDKGVILLVYMSHAGAEEGYGLKVGEEPMYMRFARKVRDWEADGAIVSAKSLDDNQGGEEDARPLAGHPEPRHRFSGWRGGQGGQGRDRLRHRGPVDHRRQDPLGLMLREFNRSIDRFLKRVFGGAEEHRRVRVGHHLQRLFVAEPGVVSVLEREDDPVLLRLG